MTSTVELYRQYHEACPFEDFGTATFQGERAAAAYSDAKTVLDFGCGNGYAVRRMRARGADWHGVEFSETAYQKYLAEPWFYQGDTTQFADRQFDMAYSTEVFEHVPEDLVESTVADLCRVTAKYLFLTISLRPSSDDNRYHCTLKSRGWWEAHFTACNFLVDRPVIDLYQPRTLKSTRKVMRRYAQFGPTAAAFCADPPYSLGGEKEFWYFAFRRRGVPAPPRPRPEQPWVRRKMIPAVRQLLQVG